MVIVAQVPGSRADGLRQVHRNGDVGIGKLGKFLTIALELQVHGGISALCEM